MNGLPRAKLPPLSGTHTRFTIFSAAAFALLYTETGAYNVRTAGTRPPEEMAYLLAGASLLVFAGFVASLLLPSRVHGFPEGEFKDATPALHSLSNQLLMGTVIFVSTSTAALLVYLYLIWPDLVSAHNLIKDLFIYTMVGIIYYQGLVAFVRYIKFLYRERMDSASKVMVAEASLGLFTLVVGLYLLTLDVMSLSRVPDPTGIVGMHVALRDIWMTIIILVAYGWHLKRVADH